MRALNSRDFRTIALFVVAIGIGVAAILVGDAGGSKKAIGGLVFGPLSIAYSVWGFRRQSFPEISIANRKQSPVWFWFCVITFVVLGFVLTIIGIQAITE